MVCCYTAWGLSSTWVLIGPVRSQSPPFFLPPPPQPPISLRVSLPTSSLLIITAARADSCSPAAVHTLALGLIYPGCMEGENFLTLFWEEKLLHTEARSLLQETLTAACISAPDRGGVGEFQQSPEVQVFKSSSQLRWNNLAVQTNMCCSLQVFPLSKAGSKCCLHCPEGDSRQSASMWNSTLELLITNINYLLGYWI